MKWLNRNLVIESLKELSDLHVQERLWTGKGGQEQSSFVEAVEGLFTDSGLGDALRAGATGFRPEVEARLRELEKQLAKVRTRRKPENIIDDPAMPYVRQLSAEILALMEI